jgi:hypothetical protein
MDEAQHAKIDSLLIDEITQEIRSRPVAAVARVLLEDSGARSFRFRVIK